MRRTALVTGAGSGIGALAARRLAAAAWDVVAVDADGAGLAETALRSPNTHTRTCDVTDAAALADVLAMAGPVHRAVHAFAAAPPASAPILEQSPDEMEQVLRTGFLGTVHVVRAVLPAMLERGRGELVLCPPAPVPAAPACAAAAVAAYADALWAEHRGRGVTIRCALVRAGTPPRRVLDAVDRSLARPDGVPRVTADGAAPGARRALAAALRRAARTA